MERNYINNEKSLIKMTKDKNQSNLKKKQKNLPKRGLGVFNRNVYVLKNKF